MTTAISPDFAAKRKPNVIRKEEANVAVSVFRIAQTEDGKRLLAYLDELTDRPVPVESLQPGAIYREGQRAVFRNIRSQIALGEKALYGS